MRGDVGVLYCDTAVVLLSHYMCCDGEVDSPRDAAGAGLPHTSSGSMNCIAMPASLYPAGTCLVSSGGFGCCSVVGSSSANSVEAVAGEPAYLLRCTCCCA